MKKPLRQMKELTLAAGALGAQAPAQPPDGAKRVYSGAGVRHLVPVSFVARDWKVTPRRVRFLLAAGRLEGQRQANGYWEVYHPYRVVYGLRGPALKRQKKPELKAECLIRSI